MTFPSFWVSLYFITSSRPISCLKILWMEEILHQLIGVLSRYLKGLNHPFGGAGFLPLVIQDSY